MSGLRNIIQYSLILAATGLLIWFSLRGIQVEGDGNKWDYLVAAWKHADKGWLLAMAAIMILSHWLRAVRWRILLRPVGFRPGIRDSFLSVMVGYLVNLAIPRGGEVSRCYNLYKLEKTPVEISFGTVVVERIVDLICLLMLISLAFIFESQKLFAFVATLPIGAGGGESRLIAIAIVLGVILLISGTLYIAFKRSQRFKNFISKTWNGFKGGLTSVFHLENKWPFILYSLMIWALYFLMSYAVIRAFPSTSELGFHAVLSLFAIGAIAMAVPLPGGAGSYHVLVPQGLFFLYGIPKADAVAFTFIFHGWQTAVLVVVGAISLIITSVLIKKDSSVG
ncbi:lysylphosphatidylglycerol synthase transmembrane domain-containing protein [Chryseolinea sp. T2]|uniref:lysylphosphatidylglycerol synthase transmembrane domain-containing protein n=1 Tax=Chryseolinea sp. T2 TaxID=3129255 RepID=UPI0030787C29